MSLQIWLPLNGNLRNQGLYGESVFTSGGNAASNDNGKIGKCYSFNGTNSYLIADFTPGTIVPNEMSFCCWVKLNSIGKTHTLFSSRTAAGAGLTFFILQANKLRFDNGNNSNNASNQTTFNYIFSKDIWYHIAVIQTSTQKKLYINGILQQSIDKASANLGNNTASKCTIGASGSANNATDNWLNGYLNDVRIYDHALSDKEVEEISKGLVLHYKLDGASCSNKNLLTSNLKTYTSTDYCAYQLNLIEKLKLNQSYTIQLWDVDVSHAGKTEDQLGVSVYLGGGSNNLCSWFGPENFVNGHADYLVKTFKRTSWNNTTQANNLWLNIYNSPSNATGSKYMHIGAWKLEKGEAPTGWGEEENICYDSSGYGNDGTIVGSLSAVTDTPKYNCATYINGANYISNIPIINPDGNLENEFSIFTWIKRKGDSSVTNTIIYRGMVEFYIRENNTIRISWYAGKADLTYAENTWAPAGMTVPLDELVYVGFTFKNGVFKCYRNGIYLSNSNRPPYIRGSYSGDSYIGHQNYLDAEISDLRIYKTCLSDDQVKELYNTSATIDNLGNTYAREFDENSNLNITKTGLFQASEIKDGDYQIASILKNTNSIQGNNLYEY